MLGSSPPRITRERTGARLPINDPYTATHNDVRGGRRSRASRSQYNTARDWATLDPTARADYHRYDRQSRIVPPSHLRGAVDLASDYVDVWAEHGDSYESHMPFQSEWQAAMQRHNLQAASSHQQSSSSSSMPYDPLGDALYAALGDSNDTHSRLDASSTSQALESPPLSDEMHLDTAASDAGDEESASDASDGSLSSSASSTLATPTHGSRRSLDAMQFPTGGKNARRKRERSTARIQQNAERAQRRVDETEQEIRMRSSTSAQTPAKQTSSAGTSQPMMKGYTADHLFDALDAAVKHAQAHSSASTAEQNSMALKSTRAAEVTPDVPTTTYMQQVCGELMEDIEPLVAYRMILTVDYIRHVHQFWSARMHVPVAARPRMPIKVAAAFLRSDCLFIDYCRVMEAARPGNAHSLLDSNADNAHPTSPHSMSMALEVDASNALRRTMVQFSCKFNDMLPEDQEEADRKREAFRPFNEAELRADVDEYCTAVSVWACDTPGFSEQCCNAMLSDNPKAFEKSPMGDIMVYWHSFAFGFRSYNTTQI